VGNFAVYTDEVPEIVGPKKGIVYVKTKGEGGVDLAMPLDVFYAFAVEVRVFRQALQDKRTEPADIFRGGRRRKGD
jgi:hypothetical protein